MRLLIRLFIASVLLPLSSFAAVSVPRDIDGWQGWVLDGQEFRRCPCS
ncbi:MAG: hypothetical protein U1F35_07515 [Steroidobacteraceae bacterium]